jgi:hypothetical protein
MLSSFYISPKEHILSFPAESSLFSELGVTYKKTAVADGASIALLHN